MSGTVQGISNNSYVEIGLNPDNPSQGKAVFSTSEVVIKLEDLEKDENQLIYDDEYIDKNSTDLISAMKTQSKVINQQTKTSSKLASIEMKGLNAGLAGGAAEALKQTQKSSELNSLKSKISALEEQIKKLSPNNSSETSDVKVLKPSLDKIANAIKSGGLDGGALTSAVEALKDTIALNSDKLTQISDKIGEFSKHQEEILKIEQDRHKFETTKQTISDLDGKSVASMSPRDIEVAKNASEARIATDTNNFELDSSDIDDLFGNLPDITELFKFPLPGEIDREFIK